MTDFLSVLSACRDVRGRTGRRAFWTYLFGVVLVGVAVSALGAALALVIPLADRLRHLYAALVLVPTATAAVRRLRDAGYSRLLVLVGLVPFVGRIGLALLLAGQSAPSTRERPGGESTEAL